MTGGQPRDWDVRAGELASAAIADGEPTAWFDRLYAGGVAGVTSMPWDRNAPHPLLAEWAGARDLAGDGRTAVVVGCGLGADAEFLAGLGFATTGFDIAATAIEQARERHAGSTVDYRVADLLDLPGGWGSAFDLVVEVFTVQALPDPPRARAVEAVRELVADGGTLVAIAFRADDETPAEQGPPWPLDRAWMERLAGGDLRGVSLEEREGPLWLAEYARPRPH